MGRKALALFAAGLAAVTATTAIANKGGVRDPMGDASPGFTDIVRAKHGHAGCGKLRHLIRVASGDPATASLSQLEIRAGGKHYLLRDLDSGVRAKQRGDTTIFKLSPRVIGNPSRYRWAATIGSNDTSPLDFDRVPDTGYVKHRLHGGERFRGYRSTFEGKKADGRQAVQGEFHGFTFRDQLGGRTRYRLVLLGPGGSRKAERGRTNCNGKDKKNLSLYVNDVGGPGHWSAKWKVGGRKVAQYRFRLAPEFEG